MNLQGIELILAATAATSSVAAAGVTLLCVSLRKRIAALEGRCKLQALSAGFEGEFDTLAARLSSVQNSVTLLGSGLAELERGVVDLRRRAEQLEDRDGVFKVKDSHQQPEADIFALPVNLNRRGQTIKLYKKGETVASIAKTLGISQGEVKLTIRMQEPVTAFSGKENSQDSL